MGRRGAPIHTARPLHRRVCQPRICLHQLCRVRVATVSSCLPPSHPHFKKIFRASVFVRAGSSGHSARSSTTPSKYLRDGKEQHPISVLLSRVGRKSPLLMYVDSCALYCSLLTPRLPRYAASKLDVVYGMSSYNAPLNGPPWKVYPDNGTINGAYQNTT